MITIQIANGSLDVNSEQNIEINWKAFRFSEGLRDQYTNDMDIPKTQNNIRLLECYNLLDSPNQMYGSQIKPAVLAVDGRMTDCYLQVVSVNDDSITICLYESTFPPELRDKYIGRMFEDNDNTIIAWNTNTLAAYPDWFKQYDYGMPYDKNYAQLHPVKKLDDLLVAIGQHCNMTIPSLIPNWYVMATGKYICPQNHRQTVEGKMDTSTNQFSIMGGQHITNDLEYSVDLTDNDRITFNRDCDVNMQIWISWKSKNNSYKVPFVVNHWHYDTQTNTTHEYWLDGLNYTNDITFGAAAFQIKRNDHISFGVVNGSYYDMVSMVADLNITGYSVTDDDYGKDMQYVARLPRLTVYQYAANSYEYWYFDASTYDLGWHKKQTPNTLHRYIQTPWTSFAWFGYYANLANITAANMIWGLGWLLNLKPIISNGVLEYVDAYTSVELKDAYITDMRPSSEHFGRKNYIKWHAEDTPELVSEIDNIWLEDEVTLHESPFGRVRNLSQWSGIVDQYSNPEYDDGRYNVDFEDVGFVIMENVNHVGNMQVISPYIRDIPLHTFGLEDITSTMEVDIESFDIPTEPFDYLYLDGRKFMAIEGNVDLKTKQSNITAILVPTKDIRINGNHIIDFTDLQRQR